MKEKNKLFPKTDYKQVDDKRSLTTNKLVIAAILLFCIAGIIGVLCTLNIPITNGYKDLYTLFLSLSIVSFIILAIVLILIYTHKGNYRPNFKIVSKQTESFRIVDKLKNEPKKEQIENKQIEIVPSNNEKKAEPLFEDKTVEVQNNESYETITTFNEFSFFINQFFLHKGVKTNVGSQLSASIGVSHIIFLLPGLNNELFIDNINECFNSPTLYINALDSDQIDEEQTLFDAINTARSFDNAPVILNINNLTSEKSKEYLSPLYDYFFGNGHVILKLGNNEIKMPNNLYFLINVSENDMVYDFDYKLLKQSSTLSFDGEAIEDDGVEAKPLFFKDFKISYAVNRLKNDQFLDEDNWRKIDQIEDLLNAISHQRLDNKILLNIEGYSALVLNETGNQMRALDETVANILLPYVLSICPANELKGENNINKLFDTLFTSDQMLKSKNVIKKYFADAALKQERLLNEKSESVASDNEEEGE